MARLVVVINSSEESIADLNSKVFHLDDRMAAMRALINFLKASMSGHGKSITAEITTRDNDVVVSTSGSGSQQKTYSY